MEETALFAPRACQLAEGRNNDGVLCHCAKVRDTQVEHAVRVLGAKSILEVIHMTEAGSGCGACHCRIQRVLLGLPAKCGGRFDLCDGCGCANAICQCERVA